jgi:CubicO group peptidase (beta-lactamase class C family)
MPLRSLLQKGIERGYPGIAMMIQSADGSIDSAAAGYSDLEHHVPMRVDDAFHMASVNKTLTAVAVLSLIDDRKLSFNTTLKEYLGEAVAKIPNAARITVSQLLDHSSGIYPTNNDMEYLTTIIGPVLGKNADPSGRTLQGYLLATDELCYAIEVNPMFKPVVSEKRSEGQLLNTTLMLLNALMQPLDW